MRACSECDTHGRATGRPDWGGKQETAECPLSAHVRHSRLQAPILIADHPGGRAKVQVGGQSGHNVAAGQLVVIWLTSVITQFPAARL